MIFFSSQCSPINNNGKLPTNLNHVTDRRLSPVTFSAGDMAKIIQNFNSNKAQKHGNISIRMLKICGDTISKPLELIFKQVLMTVRILLIRERVISFLFTKKAISVFTTIAQCLLLPICGKVFQKILFNNMFNFFPRK